ncbi:hypothetical protein D051_4017 [Vibrio parahaemolyticus VPCR-2010]|nr:hypothetical protein D051_4017 [Vibrio parahaemolyticus VPCR-2010]
MNLPSQIHFKPKPPSVQRHLDAFVRAKLLSQKSRLSL